MNEDSFATWLREEVNRRLLQLLGPDANEAKCWDAVYAGIADKPDETRVGELLTAAVNHYVANTNEE